MLKHELNVLIGVAALVGLAGVAIPTGLVLESFYRKVAITEKGATMARVIAPSVAEALEKPDAPASRERLDAIVAGLENARDVVGAAPLDLEGLAVLDANGRVVKKHGFVEEKLAQDPLVQRARVETEKDVLVETPEDKWGKNGEALVVFAAPLRVAGEPRGTLWFTLSLERARFVFWQTFLGIFVGIAAGATLVWFVLYKTLKLRILRPIVELSAGIEKLRGGDLAAHVPLGSRKDEFATLIASFNDLVAMLREKPLIDAKLDEAERIESANRRLIESHQRLAEAHSELQAMKEALALREKQASFQRFVRSIAHELKNPLNSANAAIEPLAAALARPEKTKEDLDDIEMALGILRRSVSRAVSIIHDLQGFAQLGEADLVAVELRRLVDDALLAVKPLLGERISVSLDVQDDEGRATIALKAFPTLLAQVFVNLFTNAAQAIEGPGKVSVVARKQGAERIHIEVKDSGPGIPAENIPKLFEPFFTTKGVAGTGLGLALTYAYLEKHGGTIEARSAKGEGATFIIDLPVSPRPTGALGPKASAIFEPEGRRGEPRRHREHRGRTEDFS